MNKIIEILSQMNLFDSIEAERIPPLLDEMQAYTKKYKRSAFIRLEGDPADFFGIVLSGNVTIMQDDYDGNRTILAGLGPGNMFAEAFVCAGVPLLPVSILSTQESEILFIPKEEMFRQPKLMQNLLTIVSKKNMYLNQTLRIISKRTTAEKLMAYLNTQATQQHSREFTIPFDRQGLADYLGVERSAMSAELSKLQKQGVLETKKNHFKLN